MSSVTAEPHTEWLPNRPLTRADLAAMPDDGHRYELIDGVLVVSPSPSMPHQSVLFELAVQLRNACPTHLKVYVAPLDVTFADDTVLQPDVLVVDRPVAGQLTLTQGPLLAVEILSPSTRHLDLAFKRARYEAAACPSYWVVDPDLPSIVCWEFRDGSYHEVAQATGEETVTVSQPFPIRVSPGDLVD
jgi:Uma2 family endonuclease